MADTGISTTWADALERYRSWLIVGGKSAQTVRLRTTYVGRFAATVSVPPDRVTTEHLINFLRRQDWAPNTRALARTSLANFYEWATTFRLVESDPAMAIPRVKISTPPPNPPTRKELDAAIAASDERTALLIRLIADVGLKAMEVARVQRDDVRQNEDGDYLLRAVSLNGQARLVELPPRLAEEILARDKGALFEGRIDGHISPAYVSRLVSGAFGKKMSSEDLRHIAASKAGRSWGATPALHRPDSGPIQDYADARDNKAMQRQLRRIARDLEREPSAALSECKNLLESLFRLLLVDRDEPASAHPRETLLDLFKRAMTALGGGLSEPENSAPGSLATTLDGLIQVVLGVARIRNNLGTGHGQHEAPDPTPREARLAFNATVALAEFLIEYSQTELSKR